MFEGIFIYTMFENILITCFYHVGKHVTQCMNALYTILKTSLYYV